MFKVNIKDDRTSFTSFSCIHCYLWTYFTPFNSIIIVDFQQVNIGRAGYQQGIKKFEFNKNMKWWNFQAAFVSF